MSDESPVDGQQQFAEVAVIGSPASAADLCHDEIVVEHKIELSRDVATRLPAVQQELQTRGVRDSGKRARHPTIR